MRRRDFVQLAAATAATGVAGACASGAGPRRRATSAAPARPMDAAAFRAARRLAGTSSGKIAYVERGSGDAALFLHGLPVNGFQWRGAIDRLSAHRRCVAPDLMGMGYSEIPAHQPDSPPAKVLPIIELARAGTLADTIAGWLADRPLARSQFGASVYVDPGHPADETIEYYFAPLVSSPLRRARFHAYHVALQPNPLAGIEAALRRSTADADYLDRTFPSSLGVRRVPRAKLFFQEEHPEIIAEEAERLAGMTQNKP